MFKAFKTIRWKLTLTFLLAFGIMFIIFGIILYNIQAYQQKSSMDNAMNVLAESIYNEIRADSLKPSVLEETQETFIPFTTVSKHFAEITDSSGFVLLKSRELGSSSLPFTKEQLDISLKENHPFHKLKAGNNDTLWDDYGLRVLYYPVTYHYKKYIIIVAVPLSGLKTSLNNLKLLYSGTIPLMLLLSSIAGWFFSKKAYGPVKQLTINANLISAENLNKRLPVNDTGDELAQLSVTLNNMIERLEKSFSTLKQFTSDASHELRTPLTILRGQIEVALEKQRNPEDYQKILEDSLDEVKRLQSIVDELLLLSRIESGKINTKQDKINIYELMTDVVLKLNFLSKKKNINIILKFRSENESNFHPIVSGDYAMLFHAFFNIIENAIKYSPQNSEINCIVNSTDDYKSALIHIRDNGIGISPEDSEKIFERFYRTDTSRTREESISLGLGLPIAKQIIEFHKGKISVNSSPGKGSEFVIRLPIS